MAIKTAHLPKTLPRTFEELCNIHWPRPIHDEVGYENAAQIVDRLALLPKRTKDQEDYLEAIATLLEKYDKDHFLPETGGDAIETLTFLLEGRDLSASDLGRLLGNRTLGAAILRGERKISRANARALAEYFKVSPTLFFQV